jgi:hypothetical protein
VMAARENWLLVLHFEPTCHNTIPELTACTAEHGLL